MRSRSRVSVSRSASLALIQTFMKLRLQDFKNVDKYSRKFEQIQADLKKLCVEKASIPPHSTVESIESRERREQESKRGGEEERGRNKTIDEDAKDTKIQ